MQHYTTKEQSKRLTQIGIPDETSDMFYENTGWVVMDMPRIRTDRFPGIDIPCWTTGQLLDVYRATREFLKGKWVVLRVLEEDEINCETIVKELEKVYNHIHAHYDCSIGRIKNFYDFSKITL